MSETLDGIHRTQLDNGLWLVAEPIASATSVAMTLMTPAGVAHEPEDGQGLSALTCEMLPRGSDGQSSREVSDALDELGVLRDASVQTRHLRMSATMLGSNLSDALPLLADQAIRSNLEPGELEPARDLCLQSIEALQDEPRELAMLRLRELHQPKPYGRSPYGQTEALKTASIEDLRRFHASRCVPNGSVLSFAGHLDWSSLVERVQATFGAWDGPVAQAPEARSRARGVSHIQADTTQVQIALAYDAPAEPEEDSLLQKMAVAVLSGGMSGRLFTEVREKRGLCYAVHASYFGDQDRGGVLAYAGTTTPRAQEALDVLVAELDRLSQGIEPDEFERAVVGVKSRLVMQGESTGARALAVADDQHTRGRPRSLAERAAAVDALTLERLNAYVQTHPPGEMTIVTLGPEALKTDSTVRQVQGQR